MGCGASTAGAGVVVVDPNANLENPTLNKPQIQTSAAALAKKQPGSPASSPPSSVGTADGSGDRAADMPLSGVIDPASDPQADGPASPDKFPPLDDATPQIDPTWLFDAAREGSVDTILEYSQREGGDLSVTDKDGNTLLHWAVLTEKPTVASTLIDHGVDVNALNQNGVSALFYASMIGDGAIASLLVSQGARVNLHRVTEVAAPHAVVKDSTLVKVEIQPELAMACTPLQAATVQGHFRIALYLVQKGGDVSVPAHGGNTALHFACMKSYVGLASFLIESGASLAALNDAQLAPVDVAEEGMKELLFEDTAAAAAADGPNPDGSSPKKSLSFNDEAEIVVIENAAMLKGGDADVSWYKDGLPGAHVFGKAFLEKFTDSEWKTRVSAIKVLTREVENVKGDPKLIYESLCAVLTTAYADKVAQVYLISLDLLRRTVATFADKVDQLVLYAPLLPLLQTVVTYTGKSQEKVRNESFKAVLFVARQSGVGPAPIAELVLGKKDSSSKKWRPLYGRLKILAQMVFEFKFAEGSGLDLESVVMYALPAFEHSNEQVRKAAVDLFVESYMLEGAAADGYVATLKPSLQTMIRAELASIDAPVAPPAVDRPPPTASRLQDGTACRPGTASDKRPGTSSQLIEQKDGSESLPYADPVSVEQAAIGAYYSKHFGEEVARSFLGKSWQTRVAALQKVEQQLTELVAGGEPAAAGLADAAYKLIFHAISDKVPHVYSAALTVLQIVAAEGSKWELTDSGADVLRARTVRAVVSKLEDRNSRTRTRSEQALIELTRAPSPFGHEVVCKELMASGAKTVIKKTKSDEGAEEAAESTKLAPTEGQLKLLSTMVMNFGIGGDSLQLEAVMAHINAALDDRDKKVRKVGVAVYVAAWRKVGTGALAPFVQHLKPQLKKILKNKTEGKPVNAASADSDGVEEDGILFYNEETAAASGAPKAPMGDGSSSDAPSAGGAALPYASNLPAELQAAVAPLAEAFGQDTMQCFYSKQWAPREAALRRVEAILRNMDTCDRRLLLYTVFMLENALVDKVAQVFWGGLSLLRTVVGSYTLELAPMEVQYSTEKLMPLLVSRLGDSNTRTAQAVEQTCLYFAWKATVGGAYVARHVLADDHKKNVKALINKLMLLSQLVTDFGVGAEGVSLEELFGITRPALEHRDAKVRKAAIAAYVAAHQRVGQTEGEKLNELLGECKPVLRDALTKAVMDAPHREGSGQRPKTPAAFIFDRPSTAAARLSNFISNGEGPQLDENVKVSNYGNGRAGSPVEMTIEASAGGGGGGGAAGASSDTTGFKMDPNSVSETDRVAAEAALKGMVEQELNELTGLSGSLDILKQLFGEDLLLQFRQTSSSEREEALELMQDAIWSHGPMLSSEEAANSSFEACCHLSKHALADKTMSVQSAGLDLLKAVVVTHSRRLGAFEMRLALGSLVGMILGLASDGAIRLRGKAEETVIFLAHHPKVGPGCVGRYLLESAAAPSMKVRKDKGRAQVLTRLKLLDDLVGEVTAAGAPAAAGAGGSPKATVEWPMETVATFCASCIGHHKSTAVRNKAKSVAVHVCRAGPAAVAAIERLIAQPPVSDAAARELVSAALRDALEQSIAEQAADGGGSMAPGGGNGDRRLTRHGSTPVEGSAALMAEFGGRAQSAGLPGLPVVAAGAAAANASEQARRELVSWPAPDPSTMLSFPSAGPGGSGGQTVQVPVDLNSSMGAPMGGEHGRYGDPRLMLESPVSSRGSSKPMTPGGMSSDAQTPNGLLHRLTGGLGPLPPSGGSGDYPPTMTAEQAAAVERSPRAGRRSGKSMLGEMPSMPSPGGRQWGPPDMGAATYPPDMGSSGNMSALGAQEPPKLSSRRRRPRPD